MYNVTISSQLLDKRGALWDAGAPTILRVRVVPAQAGTSAVAHQSQAVAPPPA